MGSWWDPAAAGSVLVELHADTPAGPRRDRAETAWSDAPCPVLAVDAAGTVTRLNQHARALLVGAAPGVALAEAAPDWLSAAHRRLTAAADGAPAEGGTVSGAVGDRTFAAHPARRENGHVVWWLVEDTGRQAAEEALDAERRRTAFLSEASTALLSSLNVERCTDITALFAARHLADVAVVVAPPVGGRLRVTSCGPDGEVVRDTVTADPYAVPGLGEALQGFPPAPSRWIDPPDVPDWLPAGCFTGPLGSALVTPLPGHGVPSGALVLLRHADRGAFTDGEEVVARLFAARAGVALSAARLYTEQASITTTLMRELLPPRLRQVDGVEFAGGYRPSGDADQVGGDFYDVYPAGAPGQETLVVLGDVCGKGLEAAVLTGKIRNTLHALRPLADDHRKVLGLLNGALVSSHHTRFATLVLASVVRDGDRVRLRLTSAGHPAPLIVRADGRVEEARTAGTLVGVLPRVEAVTAAVELGPGETCVLYTDGITEARGGPLGDQWFGERRLRQALGECGGLPAEAVVERIRMLAAEWVGDGRHDDMAVIAVTAARGRTVAAGAAAGRGAETA